MLAAPGKERMLEVASNEVESTPRKQSAEHDKDESMPRPSHKMLIVQIAFFIVAILALPFLLPIYLVALLIGLVVIATKKMIATGTARNEARPRATS